MKNLSVFSAVILMALVPPVSAQQIVLNETHLNALDQNGDEIISKDEYDAFSEFAFSQIDDDGDGSLSEDEVDDHLIGDAFGMLDDDGDGSVSESEFISQMDDDFASADKDGNGQLN